MQDVFFEKGMALVGGREVPFAQVTVQGKFSMYLPESFEQDQNISGQYSYFSNKGKSPLGIALKFAHVKSAQAREKLVRNYFGGESEIEPDSAKEGSTIAYREAVHAGETMSIYSLRFSVELTDGVLFGCFNAANQHGGDWKPTVLKMLQSIEIL